MAKLQSTLPNMIISLAAITFVFSAIIGLTYVGTKKMTERNAEIKEAAALKKVLPSFNNNPVSEKTIVKTDRGEVAIYTARQDNTLVGTAVESLTIKGYSGLIRVVVGFLPNGEIYNIEVLEHRETPGLGAKIDTAVSNFVDQFKTKHPDKFILKTTKDGGHVDGITAATITSRAYCDAVQFAYDIFKKRP